MQRWLLLLIALALLVGCSREPAQPNLNDPQMQEKLKQDRDRAYKERGLPPPTQPMK